MPETIHNPVLPGFFPDPSIVRVGGDYYLANSTFEWFPGVPIHHSRDLVNWRLIGHALTRPAQLDLRGVGDSAGVWAPSLSHHDGAFHLVYTTVRTRVGPFKDVCIFLTTAPAIDGPWSDPVSLAGGGFDPSLFHDSDGRKWLVNIEWDHRKGKPRFAGIVVQEYDPRERRLVGPVTRVFRKQELIEGPNLYKVNGWYYLMLAEGGTGWNHGISMARSRSVTGPYEPDPQPLVLTSRKNPSLALQKAGHGELVQTPAGEWYLAHLASRPLYPERRSMLGRETCIQKVRWSDDGWLRLEDGSTDAKVDVPAPRQFEPHPWPAEPVREEFDAAALSPHWSSLRVPIDESWASLRDRPGWLRLRGRESQHSLFDQSLLARRLRSFVTTVQTCLEFDPQHFTQSAGLLCWYDARTHYYLRVTHDEALGKCIGIVLTDDGAYDELTASQISILDWPRCHLRAQIEHERLQFSASADGRLWQPIGPTLDASKLSDDYGQGLHFTGAMVGICCQDLRGAGAAADFDYFEMNEWA
ncbi:MAG TPA: glycoside hydrolase family 43 protein [Tepidisphaeraceae bacterium]|nr:glycoside hydrolase family 43 protein [Tepidisphaeraceae bacterium]